MENDPIIQQKKHLEKRILYALLMITCVLLVWYYLGTSFFPPLMLPLSPLASPMALASENDSFAFSDEMGID